MEIYYRRSSDNGKTWGLETKMSNSLGKLTYSPYISTNGSYVDIVWAGLNGIMHKIFTPEIEKQ